MGDVGHIYLEVNGTVYTFGRYGKKRKDFNKWNGKVIAWNQDINYWAVIVQIWQKIPISNIITHTRTGPHPVIREGKNIIQKIKGKK